MIDRYMRDAAIAGQSRQRRRRHRVVRPSDRLERGVVDSAFIEKTLMIGGSGNVIVSNNHAYVGRRIYIRQLRRQFPGRLGECSRRHHR